MTLTMQRVCEILDAMGSRGTPGPLGVELPVSVGNWHCRHVDMHRLECGSGIAGRSNKWRLVNISTGESSESVSTERGLRKLVTRYWRRGVTNDAPQSDAEVKAMRRQP